MSGEERDGRADGQRQPTGAANAPQSDRAARLAEELRANLKKRKALARARGEARRDDERG